MFGLPEKSLNKIKEAIAEFSQIEKAYIFGSRAMGNFKRGSDVDIAITGEKVDWEVQTRLSGLLNERLPLPYYFDVVDYTHLKHDELRQHIEQYGIIIYEAEKFVRE